jgi:hypothetical protein
MDLNISLFAAKLSAFGIGNLLFEEDQLNYASYISWYGFLRCFLSHVSAAY